MVLEMRKREEDRYQDAEKLSIHVENPKGCSKAIILQFH